MRLSEISSPLDVELRRERLMSEIAELLESASSKGSSALVLNQELQRRLIQIRKYIVSLLELVRERHKHNENLMIQRLKTRTRAEREETSVSQFGCILRGGSFRFKGNLYFRDFRGRSCPNNDDYERRCESEMFPTDFDLHSRHNWTVRDKKSLTMGVKQQLLDYGAINNVTRRGKRKRLIEEHQSNLKDLWSARAETFAVDWHQISALDLQCRHSAYSCEAMWQTYLHPNLKRDAWSSEEDKLLLQLVQKYNLQNWQAIAAELGQRSSFQCFIRFQTELYLKVQISKKWSEREDERLIKVVQKNTYNDIINWSRVMDHFPGKCRSTIIGRYIYELNPRISHAPFTPLEDIRLCAAFKNYEGKFYKFPRSLFPNRSLQQLRTRYYNVLEHGDKTDSWSVEDDRKLMDFVAENGNAQWINCAAALGNHTRTSCRTRFFVIQRFLEKNPNADLEDIPRRRKRKLTIITPHNWQDRLLEWHRNHKTKALQNQSPTNEETTTNIDECEDPLKAQENENREAPTFWGLEQFKYAYDLQLEKKNRSPQMLPVDDSNFRTVVTALQYKSLLVAEDRKIIKIPSLDTVLQNYYNNVLLQLPVEFKLARSVSLPPNWSTLMGLRALCILSNKRESNQSIHYDESNASLQLFRQRLRALFYRSMLLTSCVDPKSFNKLHKAVKRYRRERTSSDPTKPNHWNQSETNGPTRPPKVSKSNAIAVVHVRNTRRGKGKQEKVHKIKNERVDNDEALLPAVKMEIEE